MRTGRTLCKEKKIANKFLSSLTAFFLAIFTAEDFRGSKSKIERKEQERKREEDALANFHKIS